MKEMLRGFDVREMWNSYTQNWDMPRRNVFLLRNDVEKPLSVDNAVWSSVFDMLNIERPVNIGWTQTLWSNLTQLQEIISSSDVAPDLHYWEVGVTQFFDEAMIEKTGVAILQMNPLDIQDDWDLLGYDVAEETLLSGLSNMGYQNEVRLEAIEKFANTLNNYHLFTNIEVAQAFAEWNQKRDSGHGAWYVTGIYRISSKNDPESNT